MSVSEEQFNEVLWTFSLTDMQYGHGEKFRIVKKATEEPQSRQLISVDPQVLEGNTAQGQRHAWSTF
jgi:hypothetical protein